MPHRAPCLVLALLPLCLASACTTVPAQAPGADPGPPPAAAGQAQTVSLGMGQPARLADGSELTYTRLIDDSRCPAGVQCAWEGSAEIALRWQPPRGGARELRLHTSPGGGPTSAALGPQTVVLVALERGIAPRATVELRPTP